ncbi:MAG: hypothetical protein ABTQ73_08140 [Caldilineales bacterium]
MLDSLIGKAKQQMGGVEGFFAGLPGVKGYKEKEQRREADKTVRLLVARKLDDQKIRLSNLQMDVINSGQLGLLDDMERAATRLQTLIDRIRTASYGYAPLFDDARVKEAELEQLAKFDEAMFKDVESIETILNAMQSLAGHPDSDWMEAIRGLNTALATLNTEFGHRSEVILQTVPTDLVPSEE